MRAMNGLRAHLPLLLALSANSPFWQGRETGLASTRTPMFGAFPRVGLPARLRRLRRLRREHRPAAALRRLSGADVPVVGRAPAAALGHRRGAHHGLRRSPSRTPPRLVALVQSLVHMEDRARALRAVTRTSLQSCSPRTASWRHETACRRISWIPAREGQVSAHEVLSATLDACAPHAEELGCREELEAARELSRSPGAERQRERAREARGLARPRRGAGRRLLMCGLGGEVAWARAPDLDALARIGDALAPRGPDGAGAWHESGVALVHRRLKIIDLTARGDQPLRRPRAGARDRLQRLHLQPPRAARGAGRGRLRVSLDLGHRGDPQGLPPLGGGALRRSPDRHVRVCDRRAGVGTGRAWTRSAGDQAAVPRRGGRRAALRLDAAGAARRGRRDRHRDRPGRASPLPQLSLRRAGAPDDPARSAQARAGDAADASSPTVRAASVATGRRPPSRTRARPTPIGRR